MIIVRRWGRVRSVRARVMDGRGQTRENVKYEQASRWGFAFWHICFCGRLVPQSPFLRSRLRVWIRPRRPVRETRRASLLEHAT
jgi:hypothetical protein